MAKKKSTQQRMSLEKYVELTDWLKINKRDIEVNHRTQGDVALLAEVELGYVVPITSIQRCAKIAKIKWAYAPPEPPKPPIEREAIIILIGALSGLYVETGRSVPAELANLQSTYVRETQKESCAAFDPHNKGDELHRKGHERQGTN
jgi:hypothetical protein